MHGERTEDPRAAIFGSALLVSQARARRDAAGSGDDNLFFPQSIDYEKNFAATTSLVVDFYCQARASSPGFYLSERRASRASPAHDASPGL